MVKNTTQMKFVYNKENIEALERFVEKKLQKIGVRHKERFNFVFILLNLLKVWSEYISWKKISAPELAINFSIDRSGARVNIIFDQITGEGMVESLSELVERSGTRRKIPLQRAWELERSLTTPYYRWELLRSIADKLNHMKAEGSEKIVLEYSFKKNQEMAI